MFFFFKGLYFKDYGCESIFKLRNSNVLILVFLLFPFQRFTFYVLYLPHVIINSSLSLIRKKFSIKLCTIIVVLISVCFTALGLIFFISNDKIKKLHSFEGKNNKNSNAWILIYISNNNKKYCTFWQSWLEILYMLAFAIWNSQVLMFSKTTLPNLVIIWYFLHLLF